MKIFLVTRHVDRRPGGFRLKCLISSLRNVDEGNLSDYALVTFSKRHNRISISTFRKYATKTVNYELERGTFRIQEEESQGLPIREITVAELRNMLKCTVRNNQHFNLFS